MTKMLNYKARFHNALIRHLTISRDVSKHFLKIGKAETSTVITQKVEIVDDGNAHLKTTITLLPVRRMYINGSEIVGDEYLLHEMEEDVEL